MKRSNLADLLKNRPRQLRWRLTISFALVALATVLIVEWWGLAGASLYLSGQVSLQVFLAEITRIALMVVLPTALVMIVPAAMVGALLGQITTQWLDHRLRGFEAATRAWQNGDFSQQINDTTGDEISELAVRLNEMAGQFQLLIQTRQKLAGLEERNHLARELHDSVKQAALAATMLLGAARSRLATNPQAAEGHLQEAENLVHQMQQELTGLIWELRPAELAGSSLKPALQSAVETWSRQTHISTELTFQGESVLAENYEEILFRIAQEALANIARHSQATQARLEMIRLPGIVTLRIHDNGVGFDPAATGATELGLRSMRERAAEVGGNLLVESSHDGGTTISASLPL